MIHCEKFLSESNGISLFVMKKKVAVKLNYTSNRTVEAVLKSILVNQKHRICFTPVAIFSGLRKV